MRILTVIAAHTDSAIKRRCLEHSLREYARISDAILIANSEEVSDADWEDGVRRRYPAVTCANVANSAFVDTGKWHTALNRSNWRDYDFVLLVNDSVIVTGSLDNFVAMLRSTDNAGVEMFGMVDSNETAYHLQSHFRAIRSGSVPKFLAYVDDCRAAAPCEVTFLWIILVFEVKMTAHFKVRALYSLKDDPRFSGGENLMFQRELNREYLLEKGFPLVKIKYLTECDFSYSGMPDDFQPRVYRSLHADLSQLNDDQAARHFRHYGLREGRRYRPDQEKVFHPTLEGYLRDRGLAFILERASAGAG